MLQILFFILYLVLCSYALLVLPFYKSSGLGWWLIGIFFLKILAGFAYGLFYKLPRNYADADTWRFYKLSLAEKDLLLKSPGTFFADIFRHGYSRSGNLFAGENTYWNDLKSNIIVKILAIMNVFTNDSYYTNLILFNFLFLFGAVGIFKIFNEIDSSKRHWLIVSVFLLPSTLFWCSGIHKDGLILSASGTIMYLFYFGLKNRSFNVKRITLMLFSFSLIFFLRNYIAFALLPAMLCWWQSYKYPNKKKTIFVSFYSLGILVFFILPKITTLVDLPAFVVNKQQEFLKLNGHSMVRGTPLEPTFTSFFKFFPHAIDMAFFRPHLLEAGNLSYLPAAIEIMFLVLSTVFLVFFAKTNKVRDPYLFFCLAFSLTILLLAGYTIPFYGAIVRYRSLVLPIIISAAICSFKLTKNSLKYIK